MKISGEALLENDVDALKPGYDIGQLGAAVAEGRGLTVPLPPAHPMVCGTPATRLVGMEVK